MSAECRVLSAGTDRGIASTRLPSPREGGERGQGEGRTSGGYPPRYAFLILSDASNDFVSSVIVMRPVSIT